MDDAKTRMEYIYKLFLSDEQALMDRMDGLKTDIPAAVDAMAEKLNVHTGHLLAATVELGRMQMTLGQEADRLAAQSVAAAVELAKLDIRQATLAAINESVGETIARAVGEVDQAGKNLVQQGIDAKKQILSAGRSISWGFGRILAMVVGGGCISGLVIVLAAPSFLKQEAAAPNGETAKQIEAGRDFIKVLPQLDKPARDKIVSMIQKNRAAEKK
jgi:hypothetical protein